MMAFIEQWFYCLAGMFEMIGQELGEFVARKMTV